MSIQSTLFDKTKQLLECLCLFLFQQSVGKKQPFDPICRMADQARDGWPIQIETHV